MDVCFYYLRKLLRYGPGIKISATTTDFAFDSQVRGLYDDFLKDPLVLVKQTSLFSYPIGLYMPCNTSWREVDHVLMPLRMYNSAHWILCHFDNKEMCLNIYNSYTKIVKEPVVLEAVRPFLVMIPYLLFHTGFFEGKNIPEQEALKPLVVKMVPKLPQQKNDFLSKFESSFIVVIEYSSSEIEVKLQSNEEILKRLAEIEAKVESNDIILKRLTDIESKIQSNEEIQNRLAELEMKVQSNIQVEKQIKELEEKVQSNEKILERVANVESKVNDLQKLKNDAENVANDTMDLKKNLTDCPSFSLGIEFDMTGKSIEGLAETNVEKSIDEDIINFNEEDWKIVDDVAAHSLAQKMHQNTVCASSSKTCEIDVNDDDVELKDEDRQKIDEIAAAVLAKHKLEEAIVLFDYFLFE
ncbi:Uncharacterized protein Adt_47600 [Abeliophyllum distichum]|uniref:Ubiquitin-like protease family profile domain-containing protein n=1 Tax=Abeliophyllum distichum TaxID=126358 RepID=A0ABD1NU08_9LAMI